MGLEELRRLKDEAKQPKTKKAYYIPKVSKKRQKQIELDKLILEQDKDFYLDIWRASPHRCQECDCPLGKECLSIFMHHLLPKAKYPQFRHTPENIAIVCLECHSKCETNIDFAPRIKQRKAEIEKLLLDLPFI